jgi:hypothetical protein
MNPEIETELWNTYKTMIETMIWQFKPKDNSRISLIQIHNINQELMPTSKCVGWNETIVGYPKGWFEQTQTQNEYTAMLLKENDDLSWRGMTVSVLVSTEGALTYQIEKDNIANIRETNLFFDHVKDDRANELSDYFREIVQYWIAECLKKYPNN